MATDSDYREWFTTLSASDQASALAAGVDRPLPDDFQGHNSKTPIRDEDGLPRFSKNGTARVQEAIVDHSDEQDQELRFDPDLAEALRKVFLWLIGDRSAIELLKSRTESLALKVFVIARILRLNDYDRLSLASVAKATDQSRAGISKVSCNLRDLLGDKFLSAPGDRQSSREGQRRATLRAWEKRRALKG
ncbi:MAG: hypothetical protein EBY29_10120 [Planctomycetes bacterium]|nr:hypothetical protein [Planctomycetota bacterium]